MQQLGRRGLTGAATAAIRRQLAQRAHTDPPIIPLCANACVLQAAVT
jgi:hypothetical protein